MAPLQYVFAYVSSDYLWENPAPVCVCICLLRWSLLGNAAQHSLQKKVYFSWMCCHMCLKITSLLKFCTTLITAKWHFEPYFTMCTLLLWLLWLNLHTKVLSHSAHRGLWLKWRDCLCFANLFLEVNLSSQWALSTLLTSLWVAPLCCRAWSRLPKAWPQIWHILQAAGLKCCVRCIFKWVVVVVLKAHWSHWLHCKCSDWEECGDRTATSR